MAGETSVQLAARIRERRDALKLTQKALAERAGFQQHQTISQIEKGEREVKAWELARIANALHVSVVDLLSETAMEPSPAVLWRQAPAEDKAVREAEFLESCRRYAHVEQLVGIETPRAMPCALPLDLAQCTPGQVAELAAEVRRHLGLGERPAAELVKALEDCCGVKIWYANLGKEASAASVYGDFGPAILMNSTEAPWRRNYNFAHELFHLLTWNDSTTASIQGNANLLERADKLADRFASHLLLPADVTLAAFDRRVSSNAVSYADLITLARELEVSTAALLWRLANLGRLKQETVNQLLDNEQFRRLDRTSMRGRWWDPPPIPERFVRLAFLAYSRGRLSKARLAEYLGVTLTDLPATLMDYGLDESADYDTTVSIAA
jgi:XRE family transcriptional regulator, fatty acid utilization regulator